jgi:hypothetical protein
VEGQLLIMTTMKLLVADDEPTVPLTYKLCFPILVESVVETFTSLELVISNTFASAIVLVSVS